MSSSAARNINITFTGDVNGAETYAAVVNAAAPAQIERRTLTVGNATINAPTGGATVTALTIVPPSGNTSTITVKGIAGDTGVAIHKTDPTTIALDTGFSSLVLSIGVATCTGLLLIWS